MTPHINIYAEHPDGVGHLNISRAEFSLCGRASSGRTGALPPVLRLKVVCFSAGSFPEVSVLINPAVCMLFIYSISCASFRFLQIPSLGGTRSFALWSLQELCC